VSLQADGQLRGVAVGGVGGTLTGDSVCEVADVDIADCGRRGKAQSGVGLPPECADAADD